MEFKVFWSWQDDLPKVFNKHFIGDCLSNAVKQLNKQRHSLVIPVVDRDTKHETGAPNIVSTVFSKINDCQVFVADVSIVNRGERRSFPNPNVLIELGYAWNRIGVNNILLVINEAHGEIKEMPFDIAQNRTIPYSLTEDFEESKRDKTIKLLTERFQRQIDEMYKGFCQKATILNFEGDYSCETPDGPRTISVTADDHSTLQTKCENGELSWEGHIQISKENPSSGQGEFTYTKGNGYAFGTHTIRRRPDGDISVFVVADFPKLDEKRLTWKKH
ncbi:MAG TPA: hypothetical protein VE980_01930 [Pyrinomonadaceae bacterium]|nr:hypothetical protein [Pyrinomonadaceae bacterium]